jgi:hypothetical protein
MVNGEWGVKPAKIFGIPNFGSHFTFHVCRFTFTDCRIRFKNFINYYDTCIADSYSVGEWFAFVPH